MEYTLCQLFWFTGSVEMLAWMLGCNAKNVFTGDPSGFCKIRMRIYFKCVTFAAFMPLMWSLLAATPIADKPTKPATIDKAPRLRPADQIGQFQFARIEYPGGIPGFFKNWYTDYPAMDIHLSRIVQRLTGI